MGTLVAGAPLLAAGPPGWAAYAALAAGTVVVGGVIYMSSSTTNKEAKTDTSTKSDTQTCRNRDWSVHSHAQGTDIGGTTKSTIGAPTVVSCNPIPVSMGTANANATYAMLNKTQAKNRAEAYAKALKWLSNLPANGGFLGQKSFENHKVSGGIRFDIDSYGPSNNFIY